MKSCPRCPAPVHLGKAEKTTGHVWVLGKGAFRRARKTHRPPSRFRSTGAGSSGRGVFRGARKTPRPPRQGSGLRAYGLWERSTSLSNSLELGSGPSARRADLLQQGEVVDKGGGAGLQAAKARRSWQFQRKLATLSARAAKLLLQQGIEPLLATLEPQGFLQALGCLSRPGIQVFQLLRDRMSSMLHTKEPADVRAPCQNLPTSLPHDGGAVGAHRYNTVQLLEDRKNPGCHGCGVLGLPAKVFCEQVDSPPCVCVPEVHQIGPIPRHAIES